MTKNIIYWAYRKGSVLVLFLNGEMTLSLTYIDVNTCMLNWITRKCQLFQNEVTWLLTGRHQKQHITPMPWALHLFPNGCGVQFNLLFFTINPYIAWLWNSVRIIFSNQSTSAFVLGEPFSLPLILQSKGDRGLCSVASQLSRLTDEMQSSSMSLK